jgi:hypothetical protein
VSIPIKAGGPPFSGHQSFPKIGIHKDKNMVLTVYIRIKLHMDLQADKSPVVVKGPFFPRVVNPRYPFRGTMCNARIQSSKARKILLKNQVASNLRDHQENTSNLIY